MVPKFVIFNENGIEVNTKKFEYQEQLLAWKYIEPNDSVLELGARYGSVSCVINSKLINKINHVCVEPDERVWSTLESNKEKNNCSFHILKGCISKIPRSLTNFSVYYGYGTSSYKDSTSTVPYYTLDQVKQLFGIQTFTALVADCEGCLEDFLTENLCLLDSLRILIFEKDYPEHCNYTKITELLGEKGFVEKIGGHQNVWVKV